MATIWRIWQWLYGQRAATATAAASADQRRATGTRRATDGALAGGFTFRPFNAMLHPMETALDELMQVLRRPRTDWGGRLTSLALVLAGNLATGLAIGLGIAAGLALAG